MVLNCFKISNDPFYVRSCWCRVCQSLGLISYLVGTDTMQNLPSELEPWGKTQIMKFSKQKGVWWLYIQLLLLPKSSCFVTTIHILMSWVIQHCLFRDICRQYCFPRQQRLTYFNYSLNIVYKYVNAVGKRAGWEWFYDIEFITCEWRVISYFVSPRAE